MTGRGWHIVRDELDSYGAGLEGKPEMIALTKADLLDDKARAKSSRRWRRAGAHVFADLGSDRRGHGALLDAIIERLGAATPRTREDERKASVTGRRYEARDHRRHRLRRLASDRRRARRRPFRSLAPHPPRRSRPRGA